MKHERERGNVLLCVLLTIAVVSAIGATVLLNCTVRLNVSCGQVRGWKEALTAAEAGGDIAYAAVRKTILNPSQAWSGWTNSGGIYTNSQATFGPNGDGTGTALVAVNNPQFSRRIELIAAPVTPFEAAVKCTTSFLGPGSAGVIDSYNSNNGPYYFCANNPSDPHYSDSRSGSVAVATPNFAQFNGTIYGNVSTNGGTVTPSSHIQGIIDNNVPFTIPRFVMPTDLPIPQSSPTNGNGNVSINPPGAGTATNPTTYLLSSISGTLTINQVGSSQTYVAIHVTGNITGKITVKAGVHARVYFNGNIDVKARDIDNLSGLAANLQFYGISPTDPSATQQIDIAPPGNFAATFYAPSADYHMNGNPDITGSIVCRTYYGNGNTSWHYDRALEKEGDAVDYRITNYVEDIR